MGIRPGPQDAVREFLFTATRLIRNEKVAGLAFGIALIATDHVFNIVRRISL